MNLKKLNEVNGKVKALTVFGTRPEAIKMAPVVAALSQNEHFEVKTIVTAQHREMLDQVLEIFRISPEYDLNIMAPKQSLAEITSRVLNGLTPIISEEKPDILLVHGDTTTTFAAGLAAFYQGVKVAHVEAGLRTGDKYAPFPEEMNRLLTGRIADIHFAPTAQAKTNLLNENIPPQNTLMFNINISGASLNNDYFLDFIIGQFREFEIPPSVICFEITETIAIANFNKAILFIQKLKNLGCRFALDDFGSGLSSFNYLKYLPVDYLKIDGSFIKAINDGSIDSTMVTAINDIAHLMGIKTIAEFVETEEVFEKIKTIGIDFAQGYWIAKPAPLNKTVLISKIS